LTYLKCRGFSSHATPKPTAFVIDRNGVLRSKTGGSKTPHYFAEYVLPLLRAK